MWVHWTQLGSFHVGFLTWLVRSLGETDAQFGSVTWLVEDNNSCQLDIQPGILTSTCTWPLMSLAAAHCRETGFQERDYPKKNKAKRSAVNLKASSDLASGILEHHNNLFYWFRIQGAAQIQEEESLAGQEYWKRRIDMKAIFVNQLL